MTHSAVVLAKAERTRNGNLQRPQIETRNQCRRREPTTLASEAVPVSATIGGRGVDGADRKMDSQ